MILCFFYFLYWLAGVLLATALSLLAALVSAGGDCRDDNRRDDNRFSVFWDACVFYLCIECIFYRM